MTRTPNQLVQEVLDAMRSIMESPARIELRPHTMILSPRLYALYAFELALRARPRTYQAESTLRERYAHEVRRKDLGKRDDYPTLAELTAATRLP